MNLNFFSDKTAEYVHKWLSHNKFVKANLKFLRRELRGYKNENLLEKTQSNTKMFWVAQISDDDFEIRPKVDVTLCKDYTRSTIYHNRRCYDLHLCKRFIWSPTACNSDQCKFVHSIGTDHNRKVLAECFPPNYSDSVRIKVLRASFPRICEEFLKDVKCSKPFCGYYHICQDFIEGLCEKRCSLAEKSGNAKTTMHNFTLNHNKRVFRMFNESMEISREAAARDIIINKAQPSKDQEIPSLLSVNSERLQSSRLKSFPSQQQLSPSPYTTAAPKRLSSAASMPNVSGLNTSTSFKPKANNLFAKSDSEAIEDKIPLYYNSILATPEGFKDLGDDVEPELINCFKVELNNYFRLVQHNGQNLLYPCPKDVKPCTHYWQKGGSCKLGKQCSLLHICKRQIFNENGCNTDDCLANHDFKNPHEQSLLKKHKLHYLSQEQLLTMLRNRYPLVCTQYLKKKCNAKHSCPNVHVCKRFLQGQCRRGAKCRFNHENGLKSRRLMKEYHISEDKFRYCVMLPKPKKGSLYV